MIIRKRDPDPKGGCFEYSRKGLWWSMCCFPGYIEIDGISMVPKLYRNADFLYLDVKDHYN